MEVYCTFLGKKAAPKNVIIMIPDIVDFERKGSFDAAWGVHAHSDLDTFRAFPSNVIKSMASNAYVEGYDREVRAHSFALGVMMLYEHFPFAGNNQRPIGDVYLV